MRIGIQHWRTQGLKVTSEGSSSLIKHKRVILFSLFNWPILAELNNEK